jgi:hypothetical protein
LVHTTFQNIGYQWIKYKISIKLWLCCLVTYCSAVIVITVVFHTITFVLVDQFFLNLEHKDHWHKITVIWDIVSIQEASRCTKRCFWGCFCMWNVYCLTDFDLSSLGGVRKILTDCVNGFTIDYWWHSNIKWDESSNNWFIRRFKTLVINESNIKFLSNFGFVAW